MRIEFYWVAVALTTIVSASRLTRLATVDKFPPVQWVRDKYADLTDTPRLVGWQLLLFCGYCFGFWAAAFVVVWGLLADVYEPPVSGNLSAQVWWVVNGILAASYLAAILMAHDGDINDDEDDD